MNKQIFDRVSKNTYELIVKLARCVACNKPFEGKQYVYRCSKCRKLCHGYSREIKCMDGHTAECWI